MEISAKIDQIFQGNLNRPIMKLPWAKKQKFHLFNQTSCQEQEQEQRNSSAWPCRFAAGKKWPKLYMKYIFVKSAHEPDHHSYCHEHFVKNMYFLKSYLF